MPVKHATTLLIPASLGAKLLIKLNTIAYDQIKQTDRISRYTNVGK